MAIALALVAGGLAIAPHALAADGEELVLHGSGGASACASCHGAQGEGQLDAGSPRLAGLSAAYIEEQLTSFTEGTRTNEIMAPNAEALSAEDRKAVADYLSRQAPPAADSGASAGADQVSKGWVLAQRGDWPNGVAACTQCHGPAGMGVGTAFPSLAGQSASYIAKQLQDWKTGQRSNDPLSLMTGVASKLDDEQIEAVAAYFASLDPLHPRSASKDSEQ